MKILLSEPAWNLQHFEECFSDCPYNESQWGPMLNILQHRPRFGWCKQLRSTHLYVFHQKHPFTQATPQT